VYPYDLMATAAAPKTKDDEEMKLLEESLDAEIAETTSLQGSRLVYYRVVDYCTAPPD
jgi:hypothetical protein